MSYSLKRPNRQDVKLDYDEFIKMQELVEMAVNIKFSQDFDVVKSPSGIYVSMIAGRDSTTDWSELNLGYSQDGNVITITAGHLWFGVNDKIDIATADITINVDQTWIYVEHVFNSGTAAITSGTVVPVDNSTTSKWPLSLWGYVDSTATIMELCWVGDIKMPLVRP